MLSKLILIVMNAALCVTVALVSLFFAVGIAVSNSAPTALGTTLLVLMGAIIPLSTLYLFCRSALKIYRYKN